jgi:hypothetical protein
MPVRHMPTLAPWEKIARDAVYRDFWYALDFSSTFNAGNCDRSKLATMNVDARHAIFNEVLGNQINYHQIHVVNSSECHRPLYMLLVPYCIV